MKTKRLSPLSVTLTAAFALAGLNGCVLEENHATGEENLKETVPLNEVAARGDPRMKRVVATLRKSTLGEELYDYSVKTGISIGWENDRNGASGEYHSAIKLMTMDTASSDDALIAVLAHELRHHWQFTATGFPNRSFNPKQLWQAVRLFEVDACAFTANFIAEYKAETGADLKIGKHFGAPTIHAYGKIPAQDRNYIADAVVPCFQEIATNTNYNENHIMVVETTYHIYRTRYQLALKNNDYEPLMMEYKGIPTPAAAKTIFSALLTHGLDPAKTDPLIAEATTDEFTRWIDAVTTNEFAEDIAEWQRDFDRQRDDLTRRAEQKAAPAAPTPSLPMF